MTKKKSKANISKSNENQDTLKNDTANKVKSSHKEAEKTQKKNIKNDDSSNIKEQKKENINSESMQNKVNPYYEDGLEFMGYPVNQTELFYLRIAFFLICILTFATRLYDISEPQHIWKVSPLAEGIRVFEIEHLGWDETHFGKFANHYLNGTFFMDVHPPLGKMLLALAGWATGYEGGFPFDKPGDSYGEHRYVGMRVFCAVLGGFCVPLSYLIVWELTHSMPACILAASLILFDNGCVVISQYILLDPILMFFMMMSVFSLLKFYSWRDCPFSFDWWGWMFCTGYFLACTFSVKWVGLFVILFAGFTTVQDLWDIFGDLSLSLLDILKHFVARVLGLIILPIFIYLFFFQIHFMSLPFSGPGDGFFSSSFQSTLQGNELHKARLPGELAYGSVITLHNHKAAGTLLHSHHHLYPKEHPPEQQQITGYSHKDQNNEWIVHKADSIYTLLGGMFKVNYRNLSYPGEDTDPLEYVYDGDLIRLMHLPAWFLLEDHTYLKKPAPECCRTKRNLHAHQEIAPISKNLYQVTGYGENGSGDANDFWRISVVKYPGEDRKIKTVKTVFRLIHATTGCALMETENLLPKWGWEQKEMACNPNIYASGTEWNVEGNVHSKVPEVSMDLLAPNFFESVYESHIVMAKTNNGFKPKEGEFTSQAWHWPINYRGQVFSGGDHRIYLLGNPIIWWFILSTFGGFLLMYFIYSIREKRGYTIDPLYKAQTEIMIRSCSWLLLGWGLHYFPFYAMGRVLYFHHYFPAYLFSAMFSGILLEHVCRTISYFMKDKKQQEKLYWYGISVVIAICVFSFYLFRGLSYGMSGPMGNQPNATQAAYRWLDTWDI